MIIISFFTYRTTSKLSPLMLMAAFIVVLIPESRSQPFPDPNQFPSKVQQLCVAQFALANHACLSILSVSHSHSSSLAQTNLVPPSFHPLAPSPEPEFDTLYHNHKNSRGRQHGREAHGHQHGREAHGHQHSHEGHRRQHSHEGHRQGHGHGHGHRHGHDLHEKRECCRWLDAIDEDCVCAMLRVKLPIALSIPEHGYKVDVEDECEVDFECSAVDD